MRGKPLPLGVTVIEDIVNFSVAVPEGKHCVLKLFAPDGREPAVSYPMEETIGGVYTLILKRSEAEGMEYYYEMDGKVCQDPYAKSFSGCAEWRPRRDGAEREMRAEIRDAVYDWEGDQPLSLPYHTVTAYALHVRGFTRDASSGVKKKGTFQGIIEKLPYLKELGINQIQCMPVYEFAEGGYRTNYWGYGEAYYFAPKSAYSADGDGVKGLKDMVKACHREGIEVALQMPFSAGVSLSMMTECLRYYVMDYHIDGFILNPVLAPLEEFRRDPVLRGTKIMKQQDWFQNVMRRFLKGDEGMIGDVMYWLRRTSKQDGACNYITSHTGFTLMDLVSYDSKHNEANGENNQDGPDYNYSWNCGAEGASRKSAVVKLRENQIRNAFFLLLLAQGTPCILAGDEFGNSQKGNNNVYCQDNPTGWLNWKHTSRSRELVQFVRKLILLRKSYPVLFPEKEMTGMDRSGCGVPDVSYHGEDAWQTPSGVSSRQLGVYYSASGTEGTACFAAYNMHWLEHTFALPALPKGKRWYRLASTEEGILDAPVLLKEQRKTVLGPRRIMFLVGR